MLFLFRVGSLFPSELFPVAVVLRANLVGGGFADGSYGLPFYLHLLFYYRDVERLGNCIVSFDYFHWSLDGFK